MTVRRRGSRLGAWLGLLASLWLSACTPDLVRVHNPDQISGRMAVRVDASEHSAARSVSAGFELTGTPDQGQLNLTTPLGSIAARAQWSSAGAELRSSDGTRAYDSLDSLTRDMLGESLPMAALFDWLRGRPWPQAPSTPLPGDRAGFEQLGWTVRLDRFADGWVEAHRTAPPAVTVRARVEP